LRKSTARQESRRMWSREIRRSNRGIAKTTWRFREPKSRAGYLQSDAYDRRVL
jgi:hypothetical protein